MQVALIANTAWLDEELATLHHIVVGLLDESTRVVQVLPRGRAEGETVAFGSRVPWTETRWRYRNRRAILRLAHTLDEQGVTLIHALDGRLWRAALELADQMQLPVVLSGNSGMDVSVALRCLDKISRNPCAIACATQPLTDLIAQSIGDAAVVRHVPPGVHLGKAVERADDETPCVVVSGDGGCDAHVMMLLKAIKQVTEQRPDLQFFFDGQGRDPHRLWRAIRAQDLLGNTTLIPRRLGHREVLLRAGALLHPQPLGRARTLTLRAMAHAVPVICAADPLLDYQIDGSTASVVHDPTVQAWAQTLASFADEPATWRALGQSAQQWIGMHRLASTQLDLLIKTYRDLAGEPIAFPGVAYKSA